METWEYPAEFRNNAVELVRSSGRSFATTYLLVAGRWMYLASVLDVGSRRLLGYSLARHMRAEVVHDALQAAITTRGG